MSTTVYRMKDVRRASARGKFIAASMFAGGGGSSVGYGLAGGRVALANEIVPEAIRTYARNFPATVVDSRDIRDIAATPGAVESFLAQAGLRPGELDVLDGSTPCTPFSNAGPGVSEQMDTATLIFHFVAMAKIALPKVVIGERSVTEL
jgi:DNA (cytosine-5)-methyltransferase 1